MSPLFPAEAFGQKDLERLEASLDPNLLGWAMNNPLVRVGEDNRLIRDLAAIHGLSKVMLARGRLIDFQLATTLGLDMSVQSQELGFYAPKERAGGAAGHLAVAKLMATWYSLDRADFARLPLPQDAVEFTDMEAEGLQEAVCNSPQRLGIAPFSAWDVFIATDFAVQDLVVEKGAEALTPYMQFPQYPYPIMKF